MSRKTTCPSTPMLPQSSSCTGRSRTLPANGINSARALTVQRPGTMTESHRINQAVPLSLCQVSLTPFTHDRTDLLQTHQTSRLDRSCTCTHHLLSSLRYHARLTVHLRPPLTVHLRGIAQLGSDWRRVYLGRQARWTSAGTHKPEIPMLCNFKTF